VGYDNNEKKFEPVYEKKVRAGKKRTYFFDIKEARNNGFSLVITESRKRFDDRGFDRTSIYIFQEDINKFTKGFLDAVTFIKTELLPDYNFEQYDNEFEEWEKNPAPAPTSKPENEEFVEQLAITNPILNNESNLPSSQNDEVVDKW
jgi:hypothetical protein